ncbi:efflux RND transporter periplasmic adaptor subunit [Oceanibaculum nanhaiense]|uniref:efflux RND transporter periplasmic adaptor subunit n=1 Tax=Oceanibaculum nanhaiense TaxID=1909734 RepID=UPI00396ECF58
MTLLSVPLLPMVVLPASAQEAIVATTRASVEPIVETVPLTGTLTAPRHSPLSVSVSGLVTAVHVDIGDRVDAGDVLLEMDTELEYLTLDRLAAGTRSARAALDEALRQLRVGEALVQRRGIPENEVEARAAAVRIATAELERLQAEEAYQLARLARHRLLAPYAGVVSQRLANVGEWLDPGTAVLEMVDTARMFLDVRVPQEVFPRLAPDMPAMVRFDALPDQEVAGTIHALIPVSDPASRASVMRIALDSAGRPLTPGMSAQAILRLDTGTRDIVVPRDALVRFPDGRVAVWIVGRENGRATVSERQIRPGLAVNGSVQVLSGLEDGVEIVTHGNEALREGQTVTIRSGS